MLYWNKKMLSFLLIVKEYSMFNNNDRIQRKVTKQKNKK